MAQRIGRKELEWRFAHFVTNTLGGRVAKSYDDNGAYQIAGAYGGYQIERICDTGTGASSPFNTGFTSARALCEFMAFANEAKREAERNAAQ